MHKLFDPIAEREYAACVADLLNSDEVLWMKNIRHHHFVTCYEHSLFVSYVAYRLARHWNIDVREAARAGLLHDLFLYDWHKYSPGKGERLHGFEHPTKALKNAGKYFDITEKEGDMIAKHMFPLTVTPPKYKETFVIVLVDKFCSFNEVLDDFIHRKFCGAKDTRIKWFGAGKGEKR